MSIDFNVDPYFDDYADSNQFYKILFKPGRSVQARELNQLQTILQKQIYRFGSHVFKEGSLVTGAQHLLDDSVFYIKCKSLYGGNIVNFSDIEGKYIVENGTGKVALVKKLTPIVSGDPVTLHVTIISGKQEAFNNSTLFTVYESRDLVTPSYYFESETASASGTGLLFHIEEGAFFAKETFLYCPSQTIVLGKYAKTGSYIVGLEIAESIVDSNDDESLLDPAVGTNNYFAPGADRYKIELTLSTKEYAAESEAFVNFIELVKVKDGKLLKDVRVPIYSELGDTLARRTYDESGDYIVRDFVPKIEEDPQDTTKLILEISPGKAYVRGYEIETVGPTWLSLDKTTDTDSDLEYEVDTYNGNYIYVNTLYGELPTINTQYPVEIHSVSTGQSSSTLLGTAYIKNIDYISGSDSSAIFAVFLHDIVITSADFSSARSIIVPDGSNYSTPTFRAIIDSTSIQASTNRAVIEEASVDVQLFNIPVRFVSGVSNVELYYKQRFTATVVSGQASITCTAPDEFVTASTAAGRRQHFLIINTTTGAFIPSDLSGLTVSVSSQSAVIDFGTNDYDGDGIQVVATVRTSSNTARTKTSTTGYKSVTVSDTSSISLLKSDVYELNGVYEMSSSQSYQGAYSSGTTYTANQVVHYSGVLYYSVASSNTGNTPSSTSTYWTALTNNVYYYTFDSGQTDNYYDHGSIRRKSDPGTPKTAIVVFSYFTHTGSGHISVDSYPIDYDLIPTFTSKVSGIKYKLTDVLDFRPRRTDDSTTFTLSTHIKPQPFTNTIIDIDFYLKRIDKVVLTRDGKFKVIKGVPSYIDPKAPASLEDSITLFILNYQSYINTVNDVSVQVLPYKRYTMKDIAKLDDRVSRVEYYTSLSLLEKEITSKTITDDYNNILFKNGFLVDSFKSFEVADITNVDNQCSIDKQNGVLRPLFNQKNVDFKFSNANSTARVSATSGIVTVPYSEEVFINQSQASKALSVNPFNVVAYVGRVKLEPESDVWYDDTVIPAIIVNENGENDNIVGYSSLETVWNSWETVWVGTQDSQIDNIRLKTDRSRNDQFINKQIIEVTQQQVRSGVETLEKVSLVPYARRKEIRFKVEGMSPDTSLYLYINGKHMTNYFYDDVNINSGLVIGASDLSDIAPGVKTNKNGYASGIIRFPNDNNVKFLTGPQSIVICDNPFDHRDAACYAESTFYSQGMIDTSKIITTKGESKIRRDLTDTRTNTQTYERANLNSTINVDYSPNASYSLSASKNTVREGESVTFVFTAQNAPTGRIYNANISGTVTSSDITGVSLGNIKLTSEGTRAFNKSETTVTIGTDASLESDEFLVFEVDVPADPFNAKLGETIKLTSNVRVVDSTPEKYYINTSESVIEGSNIILFFGASDLKSNANVYWKVVEGFENTNPNIASGQAAGGNSSGYFNIVAPGSGNTSFVFSIVDGSITSGNTKNFSVVFTRPNGANVYANTRLLDKETTPKYFVNTSKSVVDEGNAITFIVDTLSYVSSGNTVPYTITGITSGDISSGNLSGTITIGANGRGYTSITLSSDYTTEDTEYAFFQLGFNYPNNAFANVSIVDTSRAGSYGVSVIGSTTVAEGSGVTFVVDTKDVATSNVVPYVITGISSSDLSGGSGDSGAGYLTGNVTIGSNGKGYANITINSDGSTEGTEELQFKLINHGGNKTQNVVIRDTSTSTSSFGLSTNITVVNEGETVTFTLSSNNVSSGNIVPYSVISSAGSINDLDFTSDTRANVSGEFIVGSKETITLTLTDDKISEGAESFTLTARPNGYSPISKLITVRDKLPNIIFSVVPNKSAVYEGDVVTVNITPINLPSLQEDIDRLPTGWNVLYPAVEVSTIPTATLSGADTDFNQDSVTGLIVPASVTLDPSTGTGSVSISIKSDNAPEGREYFKVRFYKNKDGNNYSNLVGEIPGSIAILDPAETTPTPVRFQIQAQGDANEGDTVNFTVSTDSASSRTVAWSITNDPYKPIWLVEGAGGENSTINVNGYANYEAYVDQYDDLVYAYYDSVNDTQTYVQKFGGADNIIRKAYEDGSWATSWLKQYAGRKGQWGSYHYNTVGKAEGRNLPLNSVLNGTVTVSSSSNAIVSVKVLEDRRATGTRQFWFKLENTNMSHNVKVNDTSLPLVVRTDPTSRKLAGTGDFVDSNLTVAQALEQYTYITDGKSNEEIRRDGADKICIPSSAIPTRNAFATKIVGWYRDPAKLNRNPDLNGLIYWVKTYMQQTAVGVQQTSPTLYPVTTVIPLTTSYGVWVNDSTSPAAGVTHVRHRNFVAPYTGTYTIEVAADDSLQVELDGIIIAKTTAADWVTAPLSGTNQAVISISASGTVTEEQ